MKVLLVNKFLYNKGGSETYIIKLGKYLQSIGHKVEYFGLDDERNVVSNSYNIYIKKIDLEKTTIKNFLSVFRIIYSIEAKAKMKKILNKLEPDLIILNNIEYHLTPSIIIAIDQYKKEKVNTKVFYVAHDYQLICPSHSLLDINGNICEKCLDGNYKYCYRTKCLKNSRLKSLIGTMDSTYWHKRDIFKCIDKIICPSQFLKNKLNTQKEFRDKTVVMQNFMDYKKIKDETKENYIIYFGRLSKDKGVETLLKVTQKLKNINFVFAGEGPLQEKVKEQKNINYVRI